MVDNKSDMLSEELSEKDRKEIKQGLRETIKEIRSTKQSIPNGKLERIRRKLEEYEKRL